MLDANIGKIKTCTSSSIYLPLNELSLQTSSQLALKVEGVIGHGKRPGLFRSVRSVTLTVNSSLTSRPQHSTLDLKVLFCKI